jgi:hypothetical protein
VNTNSTSALHCCRAQNLRLTRKKQRKSKDERKGKPESKEEKSKEKKIK